MAIDEEYRARLARMGVHFPKEIEEPVPVKKKEPKVRDDTCPTCRGTGEWKSITTSRGKLKCRACVDGKVVRRSRRGRKRKA